MRPDANQSEALHEGLAQNDSGMHESSPPGAEPALKSTLFCVGPSFATLDRPRTLQSPGKATFIGPAPAATASPFAAPSLKSTLMGPTPVSLEARPSPPSIKSTLLGPAASPPPATASTPPAGSVELAPDMVFANAFKVLRTMARGRASTLYEAALQGTGRRYALKVLRRAARVDEQALQRFVHDARVASRVESKHLVEVTRAGYDATSACPWVAMELLDGETLAARLDRFEQGTAMPVDDAMRVLTGVCRGLAKAHHENVVHGDLRPANVFIATSVEGPFEVKLVDFGVAQLFEAWGDDGGPDATAWRAPEVPSREVRPAADVWSFGLLAFLLFTGRSYWEGTDPAAPLDRRILSASARAEALGCAGRLPPGFDAWFAQCVSRTPLARFKSARELGAAFASIQGDGGREHVLDYAPSRGASTASTPPSARKVTARPSIAPSAPPPPSDERPSRSPFAAPPAPRLSAPRAPRSPIHAPLTQLDAPPEARPSQTPLKHSALRSSTPATHATPMHGTRASSASTPPPSHGVRLSSPAMPTPMQGMPTVSASSLSLPQSVTGTGSHRAAGSSGAQHALTTSGAQHALSASGAQRALSTQFAQSALSTQPTVEPTPFTQRPTAPPPLAPSPHHTKALVVLGFVVGSLASLALALFVVARREGGPAPVVEVAAAPVVVAAPPQTGAARRWNGTLTTDDAQWSFVLSLRVNGTATTGWFSWRAVRVAGARVGEQVRENVEGDYDPATGTFELHGIATTNPSVLPVNAYRLLAPQGGALTGTTLDSSSRIVAAAAR